MPFDPAPSHWKLTRSGLIESPEPAGDPVNMPPHYTAHPSGIDAVTITSGFCFTLGNVIKYVWRAGLKNPDPLPDLRKARWYLDYHIKQLERERDGGGERPGTGPSH